MLYIIVVCGHTFHYHTFQGKTFPTTHSRTKETKCKIRKGNIQCQTLPPPLRPLSQAFLATPLLTRLHYSWLPSSLDRAVMYIKIPRCCNISKTKLFCFLDSDIKEKNVKLV